MDRKQCEVEEEKVEESREEVMSFLLRRLILDDTKLDEQTEISRTQDK